MFGSNLRGVVFSDSEWPETNGTADPALAETFRAKVDVAAEACQRGDFETALRCYGEAIGLDPKNHILFSNRSAIYCRLERFQDALTDAQEAYRLNPGWIKAWYRKGYALRGLGRNLEALLAFAKGLSQDSKNERLLDNFMAAATDIKGLKGGVGGLMEQLKSLGFEKSPFLMVSGVGQELLRIGEVEAGKSLLELALEIGSSSLTVKQSVVSSLSWAYWAAKDFVRAIQLMTEHLAITKTMGDTCAEIRAHKNLAVACAACQKDLPALQHYKDMLNLALQQQDQGSIAEAFSGIGQISTRLKDFENAIASHEKALSILSELFDSDTYRGPVLLAQLARENGALGNAYLAMRDFDAAGQRFEDQLRLANQAGDGCQGQQAKGHYNLGALRQQQESWDEALQEFATAQKLAQLASDEQTLASSLYGLSAVYTAKRNFFLAQKLGEQFLQVCLLGCNAGAEGKACGNLGRIYHLKGSWDSADKLYQRQLNLALQTADKAQVLCATTGLGLANFAAGRLDKALKMHTRELELAKEAGAVGLQAAAHGHIAQVIMMTQAHGDSADALEHLNAQLELAKKINCPRNEASALAGLGFYELRKLGNPQGALELFQRFLMLAQETDDLESELRACDFLAETYLALGKLKEGARYLEQGLTLAKDLKDHGAMCRIYHELGNTHLKGGKWEEALDCQKYSIALAQILKDAQAKFNALGSIGCILCSRGLKPTAAKIYAKQLALAEQESDKVMEATALANSGDVGVTSEEKLGYYLRANQIYTTVNEVSLAETSGKIGTVYMELKRWEIAKKYLERAKDLWAKGGKFEEVLKCCQKLGDVYEKLNLEANVMLACYEEQLKLLEELGDASPVSKADIQFKKGQFQFNIGSFEGASETLKEFFVGVEIEKNQERLTGDSWSLSKAYSLLTKALIALREYELAISFGEKRLALPISILETLDSLRDLALANFAVGDISVCIGFLEERKLRLGQIPKGPSESSGLIGEIEALIDLSDLYRLLENPSAAKSCIESALSLCNNPHLSTHPITARVYLSMAKVHAMTSNTDRAGSSGLLEAAWALVMQSTTGELEEIGAKVDIAAQLASCLIRNQELGKANKVLSHCLKDAKQTIFCHSVLQLHFLQALALVAQAKFQDAALVLMKAVKLCAENFTPFYPISSFDDVVEVQTGVPTQILSLYMLILSICPPKSGARNLIPLLCQQLNLLNQSDWLLNLRLLTQSLWEDGWKSKLFGIETVPHEALSLKKAGLGIFKIFDKFVMGWSFDGRDVKTSVTVIESGHDETDWASQVIWKAFLPFVHPTLHSSTFMEACQKLYGALTDDRKPLALTSAELFWKCTGGEEITASLPGDAALYINCVGLKESPTPTAGLKSTDTSLTTKLFLKFPQNTSAFSMQVHQQQSFGYFLPNFEAVNFRSDCDSSKAKLLQKLKGESPNENASQLIIHLSIAQFDSTHNGSIVLGSGLDQVLTFGDLWDFYLSHESLNHVKLLVLVNSVEASLSAYASFALDWARLFVLAGVQNVLLIERWSDEYGFLFRSLYDSLDYQNFGNLEEILERLPELRALNPLILKSEPPLLELNESLLVTSNGELKEGPELSSCSSCECIRTMLRTPDDCKQAFRVILQLIEKALQRLQDTPQKPMYTSEENILRKVGPEVRGSLDLLESLGFERPAKGPEKASPSVYFPTRQSQSGRLLETADFFRAILALPQSSLNALSKFLGSSDKISEVLEQMKKLQSDLLQRLSCGKFELTLPPSFWKITGVSELFTSVGLDLMHVDPFEVSLSSIRVELTSKNVQLLFKVLNFTFADIIASKKSSASIRIGDESNDVATWSSKAKSQDKAGPTKKWPKAVRKAMVRSSGYYSESESKSTHGHHSGAKAKGYYSEEEATPGGRNKIGNEGDLSISDVENELKDAERARMDQCSTAHVISVEFSDNEESEEKKGATSEQTNAYSISEPLFYNPKPPVTSGLNSTDQSLRSAGFSHGFSNHAQQQYFCSPIKSPLRSPVFAPPFGQPPPPHQPRMQIGECSISTGDSKPISSAGMFSVHNLLESFGSTSK